MELFNLVNNVPYFALVRFARKHSHLDARCRLAGPDSTEVFSRILGRT